MVDVEVVEVEMEEVEEDPGEHQQEEEEEEEGGSQEDDLTTLDAFRNTAIPGVSYDDFSFCWNCWGADHRFKSIDGAIVCPSQQKRRHLPAVIAALQKMAKTGQGSRDSRVGSDRARGAPPSKGKFKFRFNQKHPAAHLAESSNA